MSTAASRTLRNKKTDEPILYGMNERGLLTPNRIALHKMRVLQGKLARKQALEKKIQNIAFAEAQAANPGHHFTAAEVMAIKSHALQMYRNEQAADAPPSAFTTFARNASCTIMGGRRTRKQPRRKQSRRRYL